MHLLLSDIRILSRIHIQRLISNFSLIFLTNPCRLIRITIDLSPKRDFVRDNSLTRYSCSTISRPRLSLGDIAKTHSRMNLVSLTASHAFLIGIRMYTRPRSRQTRPLSRISCIQRTEPHFRHDSNVCGESTTA